MKTAEEIESAVKNIVYYTDKIEQLTKEQFNYDLDQCEIITESTKRIDLLGCMSGATSGIKLYCEQLLNNLKHAREIELSYKVETSDEN